MRTIDRKSRRRAVLRLVAAFALLAGAAVPAADRGGAVGPVDESFYMIIYSAEMPGVPTQSHCFATFARVMRTAGRPDGARVELHHINWFSARGHRSGSTFAFVEDDGRAVSPEPGENRTTRQALELALGGGRRVARFGPYEIDRGLYHRALRQIALLQGQVPGRKVLYKAVDLGYRDLAVPAALNCIHAVSDIVREPAPLRTWTCYGNEAARMVVNYLRPWIKGPAAARPEVWALVWEEIWRGAAAPPADTIVRAEVALEPGTGTLAAARTIGATGGTD